MLTPERKLNWPILIFIISGLLLILGLLIHPLGDPDVYIHLRDGRHWIEHNLHVDKEPFAYTVPDKPFEKAEWLYRIAAYGVHHVGGLNLLIILKALIVTLALFWLGLLTYRRGANVGLTALLLGLAVLAPMARVFPERPYIFTYLFIPLALLWLEEYRRTGGHSLKNDWPLWKLPALTLLWTNLHPGFMVMFGFLGAYAWDDLWTAWRKRDSVALHRVKAWMVLSLAVLAAGACNPQGFELYPYTYNIMRSSEYMTFLTEWMPPSWSGEPVFFILLFLAWGAALLNWTEARWRDLLPMLMFSYMGLKSYRNIPLCVIALLPTLGQNLPALWRIYVPRRWSFAPASQTLRYALGTGLVLVLLVFAVQTGLAFRLGEIPRFYPQGALTWLRTHPIQGRMLTHDIWGGYTGWFTHGEVKVFMDGRMPTYGEKIYSDYRKMIWGDPQQGLSLLDHYRIEAVLVSPKNELRLFQMLWASGFWNLVYWDDVSLLYVRRTGPNQDLVKTQAYYAIDPRHIPFFNPSIPQEAVQETRRAQTQAPESFLPYFFEGDLHMRLGAFPESRAALKKALTLAPGHAPSLLDIAMLDRRENQPREAEHGLRQVLALKTDPPILGMAACELASLLATETDRSRRHEARQWVEKALQWMPNWEPARKLKQELSTL